VWGKALAGGVVVIATLTSGALTAGRAQTQQDVSGLAVMLGRATEVDAKSSPADCGSGPVTGKGADLAASAAEAAGFTGVDLEIAVAVAGAESNWVPTATNVNTNGSVDHGLWQINSVHADLLAAGDWRDPATNARMARTVWLRAGSSWAPWVTYKSGAYLSRMAAARAAVARLGRAAPAATDPCAPTTLDCPPTNLPVESGLTPDALRVVRCVVAKFGLRNLGGRASGGHIEGSAHYTGRAVDVMIPDWSTPTGNALGWDVAEWARTNREGLGVTEVIFDAKIWTLQRDSESWRVYSYSGGPASGATAQHLDHVHITVDGNTGTGNLPTGDWTQPILKGSYSLSSPYGMRLHPITGVYKLHDGADLAAPCGTPILAAAGGTAVVESPAAYGTLVTIRHGDGTWTQYGHMTSAGVQSGVAVRTGQEIAQVGSAGFSTGCHLHFIVRPGGGSTTDPAVWMDDRGAPL
jgi:Peptidase family M23/Lysozyme like domain